MLVTDDGPDVEEGYTDEEAAAVTAWVRSQTLQTGRTAFVYDERMLQHFSPAMPHPEQPDRIRGIRAAMDECGLLPHFVDVAARDATEEEICLVHTPEHYKYVMSTAAMDVPTLITEAERWNSLYLNDGSAAASLLSCGGVIEAAAAVVTGRTRNAVAIVRPPGHHAEHDAPMGFCLFNNVAVATRAIMKQHGVARVMIVDWDVHHGAP